MAILANKFVAALGLMLVLVASLWLRSTPAVAHSSLIQASPSPGSLAGGETDFVDLLFGDGVSQVEIELLDPEGSPLSGRVVQSTDRHVRFEMDSLADAGQYGLKYSILSDDGDPVDSGFLFSFDPDQGVEPLPIPVPDDTNWMNLVWLVGIGVIVSLLTLLAWRYQQLRKARASI